jgi:tetratricopeptide (TPR) repeat protein
MRSPFFSLAFLVFAYSLGAAQQIPCSLSHRLTDPAGESACSLSRLPVSLQDPYKLIRLISPVKRAPAKAQPRYGGIDVGWIVKDLTLHTRGSSISANRLNIPEKAQRELEKALKAAAKKDLAQADRHLRAALALYPQFSDAYHNLGVIALLQSEEAIAESHFQHALELDERNLYPLFALAQVRLAHDDAAAAQGYVERFLTVSPTNPYGLSLLANVQVLQGQWDTALRTLARLEAMDHKDLAALHLLAGSVFELQNAQERAIVEYKKYLREAPHATDSADVRSVIAELQTFLARK